MSTRTKARTRSHPPRPADDDYRRVFRSNPYPLIICDGSSRAILDASDAALRAYGYTRAAFLAMTMDDLRAPDDSAASQSCGNGRRDEPPFSGRTRHARSDGRVIDVTLESRAIRFPGRKARLIAVQDISDRLSEERLMRQWADAFNNCALGIDFNLPSGHILTCNPAFARMHGVAVEEIASRPTLSLYAPEDRDMVRGCVEECDRTGSVRYEAQMVRADGSRFPVQIDLVSVRDPGGAVIYRVATAQDITARRAEEERLRTRDRTIRTFVEQAPAAIAILDRDMRYMATSRRYLADYRLADQPVIGRSHYELFPEIPERWKEIHRRCLAGAVESAEEDEFRREDGSIDWVRWEIHPWYETQGTIGGIILFSEVITDRKRSEEALLESERRFRQLFDDAPVGYHELDVEGRIVHVNRTELELLGYSIDEMRRQYVWAFVDEASGPGEAFRARISGKVSADYPYERMFRRKDGTLIAVLCKDRILRDQRGDVAGVRSALQDITERKAAERELRLMAQSVASARDCIAITDLEHRILYVNAAVTAVYGYPAAELLGKEIFILSSRGNAPGATARRLDETLKGGWHGETVNRRKDGSEFPVEIWTSVVRDEFGIPAAVLYVARDISERKRAEERIRDTESQFRLIAENVTDLIAVLDAEGKRLYLSPSYRSIMPDPEAMLGTDGFGEVHPDDMERAREAFRRIAADGEPSKGEFRMVRAGGQERIVEVRASAVRGTDGKVSQVIIVSRDVTEERKIAAQFLRAQRMESIGTLASGIAHDLNNVLAPILMSIEVLKAKLPGPGGQKVLNTIEAAAKRGSDIVRQVLAFGRGVAGDHIPVQPRHVIGEVVKIARETFPRSIDVNADLPRDLWIIMADPTQLHQVLLNIFVNARDAMPRGGTLSVSAENVSVDDTFARMHPEAKIATYVAVAISDTGEGIPTGIREKIFEPFFTTKEVGQGTGLGLSTTLAIVRSHGGFINLYSEVGKGTTFRIYFPATPSAPDAIDDDATDNLPTGHGELVLVIDDEAAIREITKETLEAYGYRVVTARDGLEGVAVYAGRRDEFSAVVTDIMMPVMDGTAAIAALRQLRGDVRIVATSGLTTKERVAGMADPAVKAFIAKPYTAGQLLVALAGALR